jgi:hypothetical protein
VKKGGCVLLVLLAMLTIAAFGWFVLHGLLPQSSSTPATSSGPACVASGNYRGCVDYGLSGDVTSPTIHTHLLGVCVQPGSKFLVTALPAGGAQMQVSVAPYSAKSSAQTFTGGTPTGAAPPQGYVLSAGLFLNANFGSFSGGALDSGTLTIDGGGKTGSFDLHFSLVAFGPAASGSPLPATTTEKVEAKGTFICG